VTRTVSIPGVVAFALMVSAQANAQEIRGWSERAFITIDVPFQVLHDGFSEALNFADTIRPTETAQFAADYGSTRGPLIDLGAGYRVFGRLGIGVTVSLLRRAHTGLFDLTVPSPIAGNRPLNLNGSVAALDRRDVGVHVQALYAVPIGRQSRLMLSAGPSIFDTRQDLVRSIEFDILPGLTTVKFDQTLVTSATNTAVGLNVGADLTWNVARHFGLGALSRYSRANVTLDPGSASGVNRSVTVHAGGLQLGGGIRIRF